MEEAASLIQQQAHEDANIIWGASIDETAGEMVKVTVIATGFDRDVQADLRAQAATRPVSVQVPQSFAAVPHAGRGAPASAQGGGTRAPTREEASVFTRRTATQGFHNASQSSLPIRERLTLPVGMDSEWDTPTFQRKGQ
jgi:cell division protein FtsZ